MSEVNLSLYDRAIGTQRAQAAAALSVVAETYLDLLENDHDVESVQALGSKAAEARAVYRDTQKLIGAVETTRANAAIWPAAAEVFANPGYRDIRLLDDYLPNNFNY